MTLILAASASDRVLYPYLRAESPRGRFNDLPLVRTELPGTINVYCQRFDPGVSVLTNPAIVCPHCGCEVKLTETLAQPFINAARKKIEQEARERDTALAKRETALRAAEAVLKHAKDEIDEQRDGLIRRLERPLRSRYDVRNVFAQRWVQQG